MTSVCVADRVAKRASATSDLDEQLALRKFRRKLESVHQELSDYRDLIEEFRQAGLPSRAQCFDLICWEPGSIARAHGTCGIGGPGWLLVCSQASAQEQACLLGMELCVSGVRLPARLRCRD